MRAGALITTSLATLAVALAAIPGTSASFTSTVSNSSSLTTDDTFGPTVVSLPLPSVLGGLSYLVGNSVTTTPGAWSALSTYSYQWQRCTSTRCEPIPGATSATYLLTGDDVAAGITLRVLVTATATVGGGQRRALSGAIS